MVPGLPSMAASAPAAETPGTDALDTDASTSRSSLSSSSTARPLRGTACSATSYSPPLGSSTTRLIAVGSSPTWAIPGRQRNDPSIHAQPLRASGAASSAMTDGAPQAAGTCGVCSQRVAVTPGMSTSAREIAWSARPEPCSTCTQSVGPGGSSTSTSSPGSTLKSSDVPLAVRTRSTVRGAAERPAVTVTVDALVGCSRSTRRWGSSRSSAAEVHSVATSPSTAAKGARSTRDPPRVRGSDSEELAVTASTPSREATVDQASSAVTS